MITTIVRSLIMVTPINTWVKSSSKISSSNLLNIWITLSYLTIRDIINLVAQVWIIIQQVSFRRMKIAKRINIHFSERAKQIPQIKWDAGVYKTTITIWMPYLLQTSKTMINNWITKTPIISSLTRLQISSRVHLAS